MLILCTIIKYQSHYFFLINSPMDLLKILLKAQQHPSNPPKRTTQPEIELLNLKPSDNSQPSPHSNPKVQLKHSL